MIKLTKPNGEEVVVNINQIQSVSVTPEPKITFMNRETLTIAENADEIIRRIVEFNAKVLNFHMRLILEDESGTEIRRIDVDGSRSL